jgi:hypothetical protein
VKLENLPLDLANFPAQIVPLVDFSCSLDSLSVLRVALVAQIRCQDWQCAPLVTMASLPIPLA